MAVQHAAPGMFICAACGHERPLDQKVGDERPLDKRCWTIEYYELDPKLVAAALKEIQNHQARGRLAIDQVYAMEVKAVQGLAKKSILAPKEVAPSARMDALFTTGADGAQSDLFGTAAPGSTVFGGIAPENAKKSATKRRK